ncbi:MAG: hypothetical protein NTW28_34715 [Candidatus Solibacter sp.]|nr:hypothetical protein [Candidatus Solibacter sp.]
MGGSELRGDDYADGGRANSRNEIDKQLGAFHANARKQGRALIAAHRVDVASERRSRREQGGCRARQQHQPDRHRDGEDAPGAEKREAGVAEFRFTREIGKGGAVRKQQRGAARGVHCAERGDERRHRKPRHQPTIDQAHYGAAEHGNQNHQPDLEIHHDAKRLQHQAAIEQTSGDHAGRPGNGAYRKIDAAAQDDERHANRHDGVDGHVFEQDGEVGGGEEGGREDGEHRDQQHQGDQRAQAEEQAKSAGRGRLHGRARCLRAGFSSGHACLRLPLPAPVRLLPPR